MLPELRTTLCRVAVLNVAVQCIIAVILQTCVYCPRQT
jgi:hypothetical protein